jgi:hypothetical protein
MTLSSLALVPWRKNMEPEFKVVGSSDYRDWIVEVTQGDKSWRLLIPKDPPYDVTDLTFGLNLVFEGHYE